MIDPKDNPPAFPKSLTPHKEEYVGYYSEQEGMTLLDYFAAKAMQGMLASTTEGAIPDPREWRHDHFAEAAYSQAQAMLAERKKRLGEK